MKKLQYRILEKQYCQNNEKIISRYFPQIKFLFWWCNLITYSSSLKNISDAQELIDHDITKRKSKYDLSVRCSDKFVHKYP